MSVEFGNQFKQINKLVQHAMEELRRLQSEQLRSTLEQVEKALAEPTFQSALRQKGFDAAEALSRIEHVRQQLVQANSLVVNGGLVSQVDQAVRHLIGPVAVAEATRRFQESLAVVTSEQGATGYFRSGDLVGVGRSEGGSELRRTSKPKKRTASSTSSGNS